MILVALITVLAAFFNFAQKGKNQNSAASETNANKLRIEQTQMVKGRPLVKKLPNELEGVFIKDGMIRAKSGYKFFTEADGSASVRLAKGGGGLQGTWVCACVNADKVGGQCTITTTDDTASCVKAKDNPCGRECNLVISIKGTQKAVMAY